MRLYGTHFCRVSVAEPARPARRLGKTMENGENIRTIASLKLKPLPPRKSKGPRKSRHRISPEANADNSPAAPPDQSGSSASCATTADGAQRAHAIHDAMVVFPNNEREISTGIDIPCRWDLIVLIDVDTDKEDKAKKEVTNIIERLKRNLILSAPSLLDSENLGWRGEVLLLCTAQQDRLEMEAELLGLPKPMVLSGKVATKHGLDCNFARVTAPFSVARRALFHEVPYIRTTPKETDLVRKRGAGRDEDASGLVFFSATERQMLIERIVEHEVRSAIASGRASPHTRVRVFPPHDDPPHDAPAAPALAAAAARGRPCSAGHGGSAAGHGGSAAGHGGAGSCARESP